jgi:hypothetical protein
MEFSAGSSIKFIDMLVVAPLGIRAVAPHFLKHLTKTPHGTSGGSMRKFCQVFSTILTTRSPRFAVLVGEVWTIGRSEGMCLYTISVKGNKLETSKKKPLCNMSNDVLVDIASKGRDEKLIGKSIRLDLCRKVIVILFPTALVFPVAVWLELLRIKPSEDIDLSKLAASFENVEDMACGASTPDPLTCSWLNVFQCNDTLFCLFPRSSKSIAEILRVMDNQSLVEVVL